MKLRATPARAPRPTKVRPRTPLRSAQEKRAGGVYRRSLRAEAITKYGAACSCGVNTDLRIYATVEFTRAHNAQAKLVALKQAGWPTGQAYVICAECDG